MTQATSWRPKFKTLFAAFLLVTLAGAGFGLGSVVRNVQEQSGIDLYLALLSLFGAKEISVEYKDVRPFTDIPPSPSLKSTGNIVPGANEFDRDLELMSDFFPNSRFRTLASNVGRLDLLATYQEQDEDKQWKWEPDFIQPCTAMRITEHLLLTAAHCLKYDVKSKEPRPLQIKRAHFWTDYYGTRCRQPGAEDSSSTPADTPECPKPTCFNVDPTRIERHTELDFAVFRLDGKCRDPNQESNPSEPQPFKPTTMRAAKPQPGQDLLVFHHPLGGVMFVTRRECRVKAGEAKEDNDDKHSIKHTCGTLPGTSGAPILDEKTGDVVAIHVKGDRDIDAIASNNGLGTPLAYVKKCSKLPEVQNAIGEPDEKDAAWWGTIECPKSDGNQK